MKNGKDVDGVIYCSNCKNKIDSVNIFCSYCGNIIENNMSKTNNNNLININDNAYNNEIEKNTENRNVIKNIKNNTTNKENINANDGGGNSNVSFLLFCLIFIPYLIGSFNDNYGMLIVIGGGLIFPLVLISFLLGISAVIKYKRYNDSIEVVRKIFNILNIISLIIMMPYVLLFSFIFTIFLFPFSIIIIIIIYRIFKKNMY